MFLTMFEAAIQLEFPGKGGKLKRYRSDIFYDLFTQEWIRLEKLPTGAAAAAHARKDDLDSEEASSVRFSSIDQSASALPEDTAGAGAGAV